MSKLSFLSSNANGLGSSKKQIKAFEHLKQKILGNGIIFLQETHSSEDTFTEWKDDFVGERFFSHGLTNSCGVMIGYLGTQPLMLTKHSNIWCRIRRRCFCLNKLNSNTEVEQL